MQNQVKTNSGAVRLARMWMIRGEGGSLYDEFRENNIAAIGWSQFAQHAKQGISRKQLITLYEQADPHAKPGTIISGASQVWRFVNEISVDDWVITYSPINRTYLIGNILSESEYRHDLVSQGMALVRRVKWQTQELARDDLSTPSKNSLGSTMTVFEVPAAVATEILGILQGSSTGCGTPPDEIIDDPLADIDSQALERIKDMVNKLDWDDMQQLVAGILRAMGYKTQVAPPGSDRGKDIVASPDGFGFEHPRIVVEVKHHKGQIGSQDIRSFLGGRHKDDRGLYVSTGGFTKDAQYEADRASIPLAMWTLDHVVRALIEHYDATDAETKRIVPLKRLYWPA
ncbi:restriction endonuclease [Methylobacillus flagellatus]|uniref:Restriction endonuclease n=1 Tax=Methylobacillus flagellatus (strain ATCC 51484 / DSM 6875 / VKM B-1610 / KT) TaxID=265072 RepID=Q1GY19_METFK|nr:restriction endonuclease [Methylobacillus flagellatus]ABE50868.1 restriction endonuclease [Methylobacillus flagellatus KT]